MKFLKKFWGRWCSEASLFSTPESIANQYAGACSGVLSIGREPESQKDGEKLTDIEIQRYRSQLPDKIICPDCCMDSLVDGPCGGGCQNFYCTNQECCSKFNDMGPFGIQRISDRMPNQITPMELDDFKLKGYL